MAAPFKEHTLRRREALPQLTLGCLLASTPLRVLNSSPLRGNSTLH